MADNAADGDKISTITIAVDNNKSSDRAFDSVNPQIVSVVTLDSNAVQVTSPAASVEKIAITLGVDPVLEDTGFNRMLGQSQDDFLFGGTSLDFMHGQSGNDILFRRDGTRLESVDKGIGGNSWTTYAKQSNKVWYVSGSNANDQIQVDFVTEPGRLADHHLVTRLTENNGHFSFSAQARLDFSAVAATGGSQWESTDRYLNIAEEVSRRGEGRGLSDEELMSIAAKAKDSAKPLSSILARDNDYDIILIDALGGNDRVTIGPTVQKTVWVDGGDGDDTIIDRAGKAILADKTEQGKVNGLTTRNDVANAAFALGSLASDKTLGKLTIDNPSDTDWYKFTLASKPTSPKASLAVTSLSGDDKFTLEIYAASDTKTIIASGTGSVLLGKLQAGVEYLLKITDNLRPTVYDLQANLDGNITTTGEVTSMAISLNTVRRDVLMGGAGDDILSGGAGEDWIFGDAGHDVLSGGQDRGASDLLFGGPGNDTFQVIPDFLQGQLTLADEMQGGDGTDRVFYQGGDKDRRGLDVPDVASLTFNTAFQRWEFSSLVWDIGRQEFAMTYSDANNNGRQDSTEPTLYQTQYLFYTTRDIENTVVDLRSGDDVFHAEPNFDPTRLSDIDKDQNRLSGGATEIEFPKYQRSGDCRRRQREGGGSATSLDIRGGDGSDAIFGGYYDDTISGGAGNDYLVGSYGNDTIDGNAGTNVLFGDQPEQYKSPSTSNLYDDFLPWRGNKGPAGIGPSELYTYELAAPFASAEVPLVTNNISQSRGKPLVTNTTDWKASTLTTRTSLDNAMPLPDPSSFTVATLRSGYEYAHDTLLSDGRGTTFLRTDQPVGGLRYYRSTLELTSDQETAIRFEIDPMTSAGESKLGIFFDGNEVARIDVTKMNRTGDRNFAQFTIHSSGIISEMSNVTTNASSIPKLTKGIHEIIVVYEGTSKTAPGGFALAATPIPEPLSLGHLKGDSLTGVLPLGDFNGDGIDDFVVTGNNMDYIFLHPLDPARITDVTKDADLRVVGNNYNGVQYTVGDFNGDGLSDFLRAYRTVKSNFTEPGWTVAVLYGHNAGQRPVFGGLEFKDLPLNGKESVDLVFAAVNLRENRSSQGYLISDLYIGGYGPESMVIDGSSLSRNDTLAYPSGNIWTRIPRYDRPNLLLPIANISVPAGAKPTILKGVNNGLDAITFVGGSVTKQGSAYPLSPTRNEYIANNKPMEWGTISAATRLDLIVTGDINFTLADLEPALGQNGFLQQAREKLAALKLTSPVTVDFNNEGKFRFRTLDTIVIKSIKEQVRFAASSSVMTGAQSSTEPVVAPRVTNWGYAATTYAGENLELMLDTSRLKQLSFTLDKISDDFVLNLKPELSRASYATAANERQTYDGFVHDVDFINNKVRLLVNSKATPQEIVQQLNQQFQNVPILLNTAGTFHYPHFRIALNIRVDLEAKLENGKITIRIKEALLGTITYVSLGWRAAGSRIFIKLDAGSGGLFSIENASRNFTSLLGFGNSGTAFKEIKKTVADKEEYGAAPAIMALSESVAKPWSYGVVNATNFAGINLGMLNNDSLPDYATLDGTLIRLYYGAADLQSTFKNEVFSIGSKSTFTNSQQSQIQAGDFNGDGKTDLAVTYDQNVLKLAEGSLERRVAIFYSMADKIATNVAAGRTNLSFNEADVNIMAGDLNDRFGFLSNGSGIDVNRDGVDDLVIAAPKGNNSTSQPE